jgi:hypothetical protein
MNHVGNIYATALLFLISFCYSTANVFLNGDINIMSHNHSSVVTGSKLALEVNVNGTVLGKWSSIAVCWFEMLRDGNRDSTARHTCWVILRLIYCFFIHQMSN